MSVRSRRTASVIISGSSNLPPDKLTTLTSSINKVLQIIVDSYNASEDTNVSQEEKFNKIADFRPVDKDIDQLILCLGEEMNVCSDSVKNNMRQKYAEVNQNGRELKYLINQYSTHESSSRPQKAKAIFEGMLQLVNDAIDLLKIADQYFVERLVNDANFTLINLKRVKEAYNMNELVIATQDFTTASVNLAKRLTKRIDSGVLPYEHKQNATEAFEALRNDSINVVNMKRNQLSFPDNETHSAALDSAVKIIVCAVQVVLEVSRADPIFCVDFQVDYVDDEFGLVLAQLVDAVHRTDHSTFVSLLGQIIRAVSNRSVDTGLPNDDPKIKKVKDDLIRTRDLGQQILQLKDAGVSSALIASSGRDLDTAVKNLRESYRALSSNQKADRTSLRDAARKIIASLDKLVVVGN